MTEEEFLQLLEFTRLRLVDIGRPDLDELAFAVVEREQRPSRTFHDYLDNLTNLLQFESTAGAQRALEAVSETIRGPDGRVSDLVVLPTEGGEGFVREGTSLLAAFPNRDDLLEDLRTFSRELFGRDGPTRGI